MGERFYRTVSFVLLAIIILYAGWQVFIPAESNNDLSDDTLASPDIGADAPVAVRIAYARRGDLTVRLQATGVTRAVRQVTLTAEIGGRLARVLVREGQRVRRGDTLVVFDDTEARLVVREAEEQLAQATLRYGEQLGERRRAIVAAEGEGLLNLEQAQRRYDSLRVAARNGNVDDQTLVLAERELAAARLFVETEKRRLIAMRTGLSAALIAVEKARLQLRRTRLVAPFSGVVANLRVQAGQQVAPGTECLDLVDLDSLYMDVDILESELGQVQAGSRAEASFTAFPGERFAGKVMSLNPFVDADRKIRKATVLLPNPDGRLLPGMHGTIRLDARTYPDRLLVPREAVVLRDQRPVVFIARPDAEGKLRAVWSYVELGLQNETEVEIISSRFDLKAGEPVVVSNHYTMAHDALIRIVE